MKKLVCLIMAVFLVLALVGCGYNGNIVTPTPFNNNTTRNYLNPGNNGYNNNTTNRVRNDLVTNAPRNGGPTGNVNGTGGTGTGNTGNTNNTGNNANTR